MIAVVEDDDNVAFQTLWHCHSVHQLKVNIFADCEEAAEEAVKVEVEKTAAVQETMSQGESHGKDHEPEAKQNTVEEEDAEFEGNQKLRLSTLESLQQPR